MSINVTCQRFIGIDPKARIYECSGGFLDNSNLCTITANGSLAVKKEASAKVVIEIFEQRTRVQEHDLKEIMPLDK